MSLKVFEVFRFTDSMKKKTHKVFGFTDAMNKKGFKRLRVRAFN